MKQCLVIGSTVVDVLITLPHLPVRGEDININAPLHRIGGCAYNVYKTLDLLQCPCLLCSPVGSGIYGRMVLENLEAQGIKPFIKLEEENGCCYCLIENDGERSFLSHHGAEYLFSRSWMENIDYSKTDSVYICGIEVEDPTGEEIIQFVYEHPELDLYFAPGPRIMHIEKDRMVRLFMRRDINGKGPFLHLNEAEACSFSRKNNIQAAAEFLAAKTDNALVITLGEKGCYYYESVHSPLVEGTLVEGTLVPGFPAKVLDTTGAGDAHCGSIIAELKKGKPLSKACETANKIGAAVVSIHGAVLDSLN